MLLHFWKNWLPSSTFTLKKKAAGFCEHFDKFITHYTASYPRFHLCDKVKFHFLIKGPSDRCFAYELKAVRRKVG